MKRRDFLKFLSGAIWPALWPFAARAQYPGTQYPTPTSPQQAPPYQQPSPPPAQPNQPATAANQSTAGAPDDKSIGQVSALTGRCTVTRGKALPVALKVADHIFENDALATDANATLGITFDDETTFSLSANTRIVVDKFVYEEGASGNAASFHVATGTAAFVASLVAKTGDMKISTDNATLGIRGTTGVVEVPAGGATGAPAIKLYPDADGHVGRIEVFDRQGGRLGQLTQGASAFSLRPGPNGRIVATAYRIPPQEAARDRGVIQRLNTSHTIGRQIAIQRRQTRTINQQRPNNQRPNNQRPGGPNNQRPGGPNTPRPNNQRPGGPNTPQPNNQRPGGPSTPQPNNQRPGGPNTPQPNNQRPGGPSTPQPNNQRPGGPNTPQPNNQGPGGPNNPQPNNLRPGGSNNPVPGGPQQNPRGGLQQPFNRPLRPPPRPRGPAAPRPRGDGNKKRF